jgi:para-nitrobenzyl esterase
MTDAAQRNDGTGMTDLTVQTLSGPVRGFAKDGVRRWYGIPYVRQERLAAPGPVAPWSEVRDATAFGSQCPQMYGNSAKRAMLAPPGFAEDCLDLNIYVPEGGEAVKPVYVWIHGGAFVVGSGNSYDGSAMARAGDVIVVTVNYRVGALGFVNFGEVLGLPDLPSNLGLRDQIAALEWVRDNIRAFGGDPLRVTIGGQSAGSMSVSLLLHAKSSWPLYRGAIMQSGAISLVHSHEKSLAIARRYAELLDLNQGSLERLRTLDLRSLFEAQAKVGAENPGTIPASPWFDGDLLPASLADAQAQAAAPVPLIAGGARDEIRLFELMPGDILPSKWPQLEALLERQLGKEHAARVLAAYPRTTAGRRALATDLAFSMPTRNFAERHMAHSPTWFYRFDYSHPIAGATHGLDLTLTWPMNGFRAAFARGGAFRGRRAALGNRMIGHYAHFVRYLEPAPGWPAYTPAERSVMLFNYADRLEANPDGARLAAWAGGDAGPGI